MCRMKNGNAAVEDGGSVEIMRALENFYLEMLTDIANKIYDSGFIPLQMSILIFVCIPEKKRTVECAKYNILGAMNQRVKTFLPMILNRIKTKIKQNIPDE